MKLKFLIITDIHYELKKQRPAKFGIRGDDSVKYLPEFVNQIKDQKFEFMVSLGDLIDGPGKKVNRKKQMIGSGFRAPGCVLQVTSCGLRKSESGNPIPQFLNP